MRETTRALVLFLIGTALFALAYAQAPLYYSNQNQYFLHGLARAGAGLLREDWLANTRDPTPVFSTLVAFTARFLHPAIIYVEYALLLGVYAAAMLGLFVAVAGAPTAARRWPVFVALFVAAHAALVRWSSYRWLGFDYPWFLQAGVAGQYALGAMFQPSTFAALLVAAVCLFVRGRPVAAVVGAALAATVHPTYLLVAGLLTLGFLTALVREGQHRQALRLGTLALALVLPVTLYTLGAFRPTSPEIYAAAQAILVNVRIPQHTRPRLWFDPVAGLQLAWVILAVVLARPMRLRMALAVPLGVSVIVTLAQVATGSLGLALLFPWRASVVLVPVATTVLLSRLVAVAVLPLDRLPARVVSAAAVALLVAGGVWIMVNRLGFHADDEELPVMEYVRRTKAPGNVYFVPVSVPDLVASTHGSLSSDFKPLPDKKRDAMVIPVGLQRFRLTTGAPIFVDFKSIPYKDVEVGQWYDRLRRAEAIQDQLRAGEFADALAELRRQGVTHLVQPSAQPVPGVEKVYGDRYYSVYRLTAPAAGG